MGAYFLKELQNAHEQGRFAAFIHECAASGRLFEILPPLLNLDKVPQNPKYHPEGDVWTHTLLVIENLPPEASFALALTALFHDVGKATTTVVHETGLITARGHESASRDIANEMLVSLGADPQLHQDVLFLVHRHMIAHSPDANMRTLRRLVHEAGNELVDQLLLHGVADVKGGSKDLTHCIRLREIFDQMIIMNHHKQWVGEIFDKAAPEYGKKSSAFFDYFGKRLVEQVNIPPNAHALDVATGRGAVLFHLAQAVGPSGKAIGIDISAEMIKKTSKEAKDRNIDSIELFQMDAEQLNFSDESFDFVFCGFALFFFPSIATALAEFKRVLKPGGTLVVSIWGNNSELDAWINEEIKKISNTKSLKATPLSTKTGLHQVLFDASFANIQITEEIKPFLHNNPEAWWNSLWNHGTRAKFEQLTANQIKDLHEKAIEKAAGLGQGQGMIEPLHVFYGTAKKL